MGIILVRVQHPQDRAELLPPLAPQGVPRKVGGGVVVLDDKVLGPALPLPRGAHPRLGLVVAGGEDRRGLDALWLLGSIILVLTRAFQPAVVEPHLQALHCDFWR